MHFWKAFQHFWNWDAPYMLMCHDLVDRIFSLFEVDIIMVHLTINGISDSAKCNNNY